MLRSSNCLGTSARLITVAEQGAKLVSLQTLQRYRSFSIELKACWEKRVRKSKRRSSMKKLSLWCLYSKRDNKQKGTLLYPLCWHFSCLGSDTASCLVYFFLFLSLFCPCSTWNRRSARRSITCRLKIMRATELPSRIGERCNMAQRGATAASLCACHHSTQVSLRVTFSWRM